MIQLVKLELSLINIKIEDIKEAINEALNTKFKRGKESNQFYDKLELKFKQITFILNGTKVYENQSRKKQRMLQNLLKNLKKLQKKLRKSMKFLENLEKELKLP